MSRFITSTAIFLTAGILAGPAIGADDDNLVFIDQIGADNSGAINQVGILNQIGTEADPALQNGYYNSLIVDQTGDGNRIGTQGAGLNQNGQSATPSVFNAITIEQNSHRNVVGEVQQSALGAIPDGANRLDILQHVGDENTIGTVLQEQSDGMPGQIATLIQTGEGNVIARVEQKSLTPANNGENRIRAEFIGTGNGSIGLSGFALDAGAASSELVQTIGVDNLGANGNDMDLLVTGDFNRFGVFQGGRLNSVGQITIQGNLNQIGIRQEGLENDLTSSLINGDGNNIGVDQWGTNTAYLDMPGPGDDNQIYALQYGTNDLRIMVDGDRNEAVVTQHYNNGTGGSNDAEVNITGVDNFVNLAQNGSNTAVINYVGDRNNKTDFDWAPLVATGLDVGTFTQTGTNNNIQTETIGNDNMMAVRQNDSGNIMTAFIMGDNNQAAVIQTGSDNTAWLSQNGNGNRALIVQ